MDIKNAHTFFNLTPINKIPLDRHLKLDNYVFDTDELKSYYEQYPEKIYINPHLVFENENCTFSIDAQEKIKNHPALKDIANKFERNLAEQNNNISYRTVNKVLRLLKLIHNTLEDPEDSRKQITLEDKDDEKNDIIDKAKMRFITNHLLHLSAAKQTALNDYAIRVKTLLGGYQPLTFKVALTGGSDVDSCIRTTQIYLWQFVIEQNPENENNLPTAVREMARRKRLKLGVSDDNSSEQSQSAATHSEDTSDDDPNIQAAILASLAAPTSRPPTPNRYRIFSRNNGSVSPSYKIPKNSH